MMVVGSIRNEILENMVAAVRSITIINGYGLNVAKVSRRETTGLTDEMPVVYILEPIEEKTPGPNFFQTVKMTTKLRLYLVSDDENPNAELAMFASAVERALLVDPTRSSNAIDTQVVSNTAVVAEDLRVVGAELDVLVTYRHVFDNPSARR